MVPSKLAERSLIKISGDDAETFLQNLVTNDVTKLAAGALSYGCLLTPQGRFLHDFFIFKEGTGFYLECERERREDLIRRLRMFKLRAKVVIEDCADVFTVYASSDNRGFADPRLPELGYRFYLPANEAIESAPAIVYQDRRIHLGVPEGSIDMRPDIDIAADMNLDCLNAVAWDKGCFVGQEVTARVNWRGLVKKRLFVITGTGLTPGQVLTQEGRAVGEIRSVNTAGTEGLALLRLDAAPEEVISVRRPAYLKLDIKTHT